MHPERNDQFGHLRRSNELTHAVLRRAVNEDAYGAVVHVEEDLHLGHHLEESLLDDTRVIVSTRVSVDVIARTVPRAALNDAQSCPRPQHSAGRSEPQSQKY